MSHDDREMDDQRQDTRRQEDVDAGKLRFSWQVVAWILGVSLTAFTTYNATISGVRNDQAASERRIAVMENRQSDSDRRLQRMETQLDDMGSKIDRLLERR